MPNFIDRQLLSVLVEPVKHDLGLSDTQIGLLTGLMLALFYSLFGVPVAMIADKGKRTRLIAIACGIWSIFTELSGMATGFLSLALACIGVGVDEAGCSPPSHSIISDYFPPEQKGRVMALYVLGLPIGGFLGTFAGGWIAENCGWRYPFFVVGLIGLLFASLLPFLVREPARGRYDILEPSNRAKDARVQSVADGTKFFWSSPILVLTALGRVQGMSLSQISSLFAVSTGTSMTIVALLGAAIADRAGSRNPAYYVLIPGLGLIAFIPFLLGFTIARSWQQSLAFRVPPMVFSATYLVALLALLQNRMPAQYRPTASWILLFLLNLIGLGGGLLFIEMIGDRLITENGRYALGLALEWLAPFTIVAALLFTSAAALLWRERPSSVSD